MPREYGPKVGDTIPPFNLPDQAGHRQTLPTISGPAGALIAFVRSADW
jgi:peroxiredoxin